MDSINSVRINICFGFENLKQIHRALRVFVLNAMNNNFFLRVSDLRKTHYSCVERR